MSHEISYIMFMSLLAEIFGGRNYDKSRNFKERNFKTVP